jgi:hypothetical protein
LDWRAKLSRELREIEGVGTINISQAGTGIEISVKNKNEKQTQKIEDVFERRGADSIPYKIVIAG